MLHIIFGRHLIIVSYNPQSLYAKDNTCVCISLGTRSQKIQVGLHTFCQLCVWILGRLCIEWNKRNVFSLDERTLNIFVNIFDQDKVSVACFLHLLRKRCIRCIIFTPSTFNYYYLHTCNSVLAAWRQEIY